ncbi:crotonase/enoyl-CoA hydratase family protein [Intrasporangium calvum]|uniref:Crotonase/enoyl-CoA hydratase family protein n=1 Tax=Intrasporangium calvum TaxID=53358 RepID=A0ABT5GLJ5_9MICO|nr:crotonase/enoyl-CoA hydratase family protein [Intrasporangium calvum]MDC5699104.1 crotonase/enoyl-CoA hydratase family protein [Intrasporangium calvum]
MSSDASAAHLSCTVEAGIARVQLNRPDKLNGLTLEMLESLADTAHQLRSDRAVRAVILSGSGESFCAGLDFATVLKKPRAIATAFVPRPWLGTNTFQEACWAWRRLPVPVVAAVHGHCFGGGVQIALGADFRFTTPDAQWSVLEAKWGLIPDMSGIQSLTEVVGIDVAKRLTMTGSVITGEEAAAIGLATGVAQDPLAAAEELIGQVMTRSPDAVAAAKRLFEGTWSAGPRRTFARERAEQLRLLLRTPNTRAAQRAAFTKEAADFGPRRKR